MLVAGGLMDQPRGLTHEIRSLRSFAEAKRLMDGAQKEGDCPKWALDLLTPVIEQKYGRAVRGTDQTPSGAFGQKAGRA